MRLKKFWPILLVVALLAIAAGAIGTQAWFTDQETVGPNSFAAGRLDIDVRGGASAGITISDMEPSVWYTLYELQVYNQNTPVSTMPVKYRFYDANATESVGGFYDTLRVRVRHTHAGTLDPGSWPIVWEGKLKDLLVDSTATPGIISPSLGVNITHVFYLEFKVHESAGNVYQGASATCDLVFDATQVGNPGWTQ